MSEQELKLDVIQKSYGFTIDVHGEVCGLVAGDMGYEGTGIFLDEETKRIWDSGVEDNTRTNTDLEEAQAQVRVLAEALAVLISKYWKNKGLPGAEFISCITPNEIPDYWVLADKALSSSPIELYKAQDAVIEAAKANYRENDIDSGNNLNDKVYDLKELEQHLQDNEGGEVL
jgi:hypothetical protein